MNINRAKYCVLILFFLCNTVFTQSSKDVSVTVQNNYDVRIIAETYFGDSDLWPYIFIYNNLPTTATLKVGTIINLPTTKVKNAINKISEADKVLQDAITIGAKVLAEDLLNTALGDYQQAIAEKKKYNFTEAEQFADRSATTGKKAYTQTKEIRERTFDAVISFKKGNVQKMIASLLKWQNAEVYENLKENDWARTLALSLAKITFSDLSQIKLNENSQALIQHSRLDVLSNKASTKVKLEKGDAYAMLMNNPKKNFGLDIKGVKTKIKSKYFWVEKGNTDAKIANYNGEISLETKGAAVTVKKNQGSVIPNGGAPSKPKNLLEAPVVILPENFSKHFSFPISFSWQENIKAKSYWLEFATDPDFKKTISVEKGLTSNQAEIDKLQAGVYYWHVCAVDSLGLPGPYSSRFSFIVADDASKPFLIVNMNDILHTIENEITFTGSVMEEAEVFVNENKVEVNQQGEFKATVKAVVGNNKIEITAKNSKGKTNSIFKNIYLEKDESVSLYEEIFGELKNETQILSNNNYYYLKLKTFPNSKIIVTRKVLNASCWSDSGGNALLKLENLIDDEILSFIVQTPAGRISKFNTRMNIDLQKPDINILENIAEATNLKNIVIDGKISEPAKIFVNDRELNSKPVEKFSFEKELNAGSNEIVFEAIDIAGNSSKKVVKIYYDNLPPKYIFSKVDFATANKNQFQIIVAATDDYQLKRTAVCELMIGEKLIEQTLELDQVDKKYKAKVISETAKPILTSIMLTDYLGNSEKYQIKN